MPKYIDFKELASSIDIEAVATKLGIALKASGQELRGCCPACKTEDQRSLQVLPQTNSFRCYAASLSGDCIALYAHVNGTGMYKAAQDLADQFPSGRPATVPQEPERRTAKSQPAPAQFDPDDFAQKLTYGNEVSALGISEEDAERLSIGYSNKGMMRGRVCFPIRNVDGSIAGFIGVLGSDVKVPKTWIASSVVPFKKKA